MIRTILILVGGTIIGAVAMLVFYKGGPIAHVPGQDATRDIIHVPILSQEVADKHRNEHYANLDTIQQAIALPTEFDRFAALYALAGRSDSAAIQTLIFEADRIGDDDQRSDALAVLFSRFAETDPQSALALAKIDKFKSDSTIEQIVWRFWGRYDLDAALDAAKSLVSTSQKNAAAQYLYAAFGFIGNDITSRIEAELGIGPDRATRRSYIYKLANESPAIAIEFINRLEIRDSRLRNINWLSRYLALRNPATALGYADLFDVASERKHFRNVISGTMAYDNPRDTIERLAASGSASLRDSAYRSAMRALVATDIVAAIRYFEQANSNEERQMWGSLIAIEMVPDDPAEALRWARDNESGPRPQIQMMVLRQIAETQPELALMEAQSIPSIDMRTMTVSSIIGVLAEADPANAAVFLEQIDDPNQKTQASQQLMYTWVREDQDAAIDWLLLQDEQTVSQMINNLGHSLVEHDVDAAIELLPKFRSQDQVGLRLQIASNLVTKRSPDEALRFITQFNEEPGYDQLQAALIAGVAQTDVVAAKQMAAQLTDKVARDTAYVQVIARRAQSNPTEAASWLNSIVDEGMRGAAAGQVASNWYTSDPVAAIDWLENLPTGPTRDDAIMNMSYRWGERTVDADQLIASIEDRGKRGQAKVRQIYGLMRTNPAEARKLLDESDIPAYLRTQAEAALSQDRARF